MMRKLLIATRNKGKFTEISVALKGLPFDLIGLDEVPPIGPGFEVKETGSTLEENAILKAREYGQKGGMLTLAEDSGLEIAALAGRPGVLSARYGSTEEERNARVLREMALVPDKDRTARFKAVYALFDPEEEGPFTCCGVCEGLITKEPKGSNGFGYDPIFYTQEKGKTNAELNITEKNEISHRGKALKEVRKILKNLV